MTTRITLTILLTTWIVLIVGETAAFYTARQSLFSLFDDNLITRASSTLEIETANAPGERPSITEDDHYQIRESSGKVVAESKQGGLINDLIKLTSETDGQG